MKALVQYILQKLLGFDRYLFVFSKYKIRTIHKDPGEKDFFHFVALLNDSDAVLDIGANIGVFSVSAAKKGASVYAFEPCKDNFKLLKKNIEINNTEQS